jgi:uncharacterized OsmC-like protein
MLRANNLMRFDRLLSDSRALKICPMGKMPGRQWSISARSNKSQPLTFFREGLPLPPSDSGELSPIEFLLLSVASCFALSCRAAGTILGAPPLSLKVEARGEKQPGLPNRLVGIEIHTEIESLDEVARAAIVSEAKRLCTVANTVLQAPTVTYV